MRSRIWFLAATLCCASIGHAQEDTITLGGRSVVAWQPPRVSGVRAPVVVFSHGFGGCPTQSRFLTAGLAARGYWVFAPFHRDAGCGPKKAAAQPPRHRFGDPSAWGDLTYADRVDDVRAVVAALKAPEWSRRVDVAQLAIAGHSLGGYTALSIGGAWTLMRMPGVRAVLALAPYTTPFVVRGTMNEVTLPVMFQSGALDKAITAAIAKRGGAYDEARGPKYFVDFARARHWSWGNVPNAAHDAMLAYAAAFLDRYVRGEAEERTLTTRLPGVSELRFSRDRGGVADAITPYGQPVKPVRAIKAPVGSNP
jgi:predicted dienelactone hydrolase